MKIGILTFHHGANYGAVLQTYALWKTIKNDGHDVEIIDYRPEEIEKYYWPWSKMTIIPPMGKRILQLSDYRFQRFLKFLRFRYFLRTKIKLSKHKFTNKEDLKKMKIPYEMVIVGSDQVWCIDNPFRGFDSSYFLDFFDQKSTCKKVSYAASFGPTTSLGVHEQFIIELLQQFNSISVRDSNSLRIIQDECKRDAEIVLDPTFLIDEYDTFLIPPKVKEKYLLIYNQGDLTLEQKEFIKKIADLKQLAIISIGRGPQKIERYVFPFISPQEWVGYFKNASYVITNTYHGTIFSIIFGRDFSVLFSQEKTNKTLDLLNNLGLNERILTQDNLQASSINYSPINYSKIKEKLAEEIGRSKTHLLKNIIENKTNR